MQQPSVAPTAVAGAGAHNKPPPRRKKRAPSSVQDQHQARISRSASASTAVPFRSCELLEAEHPTTAAVPVRGAGSGQQQQQHLPPRSPLKTAKVCAPSLEDALDDVQVRFVLNLPEAELSSADRLFFQLEQAWWFYEDHIADAHKHLPHFKLKEFAKLLFQHCEALRPLSGKYNELFEYFRSWKGTIPTAGCILLNAAMTDVVLVKCWKGNSRGLPKGKINQDESAFDAAMREVQEETGYDARGGAKEKDFLTVYLNGQQTTMYVVTGVDETFPFEPQVRKEISAIEWFPLDSLPKGSYGVEPFVPRLRRWMAKSKGARAPKNVATPEARTQSLLRARKARATSPDVSLAVSTAVSKSQSQPSSPTCTAASSGNTSSKKQGRRGSKAVASGGSKAHPGANSAGGDSVRACSAPSRRGGGGGHHPKAKGYDLKNHDTFGVGGSGGEMDGASGGGGGGGGAEGWDFEAMLAANERLTGRTFVYDGNPHEFGDPAHAARVSAPGAPAAAVENRESAATARSGDQGGQLKQRKSSKGPGAKSRSRSRGKDRDRDSAKENAHGCAGTGGTAGLDAAASTSDGGGGDGGSGGGGSLVATTSVPLPGTGSGALCTEGTGGAPAAVSLWGDAAVAATPSGGAGAGVFGDFKFDLRDIMNAAVPRG